jgi:tyrosyl-tRNA synthetase
MCYYGLKQKKIQDFYQLFNRLIMQSFDHVQSPFLKEALSRGFIHQCTDVEALDKLMLNNKIKAYCGYDATADSLQIGNLASIMFLKLLQKHGHTPYVLIGGGTSKVGDPSGKDASRQLLDSEMLLKNIQGIQKAFSNFLNFDEGDNKAILVNNASWLESLNYIEFLRDFGKHFSINRMLSFDSVKLRLDREQNLSFLEFNYMILQAYDFYQLYKNDGITLQMGGADQWGNIVNGVELTRRVLSKTVYGLTTPLITMANGQKMGKTANGAIWLNAEKLSPYDFWQFWRNIDDADVVRFLKIFTTYDLSEIAEFEKATGAALNDVKKKLADHVTAATHGENHLSAIHKNVALLFEQSANIDLSTLPRIDIHFHDLDTLTVEDLLVLTNLCTSKGEARRLIQGSGAKINDETLNDPKEPVMLDMFDDHGFLKISSGKKKHIAVKLVRE